MDAFLRHGGRLRAARLSFPEAPRPWIDLSTGVNPWAYPAPRARREDLRRLPDPEVVAALEARAARRFGAQADRVAAVAGAEAALRLLPRLLPARSVRIAGFTYGGHAEAWVAAGPSPAVGEADAVVVVNPNNPDGRATPRAELLAEAARLAARGGWLVVDESFADLEPSDSVADAGHPAIAVLRSFGKAYGLPGVRLGFVVAPPALAARVREAVGDWPVSAEALAAGLAAYADDAWLAAVRPRLAAAGAWLDARLAASGLEAVGGTELFRLARAPDAHALWARLCAHGILTRPFAGRPDLLRFGLPRARERARLARALTP